MTTKIDNLFSKISKLDSSRVWPFREAEKILKKIGETTPAKGYVLFESGYAPSGLPHIGTFGEMIRTSMVIHAFQQMSDIPTKLLCVSDDMDGLRSIPDVIGKNRGYEKYLGMPLSAIPNPFSETIDCNVKDGESDSKIENSGSDCNIKSGKSDCGIENNRSDNENSKKYDSLASYMNRMLCRFLDHYGFEYEFKSATSCYKDGEFNKGVVTVLKHYDDIMKIMLPTLRDERRKTYSPFMPIDQKTGKVLQVATLEIDVDNEMISYRNPDTNEIVYTKVTNGSCKLQWKPDFGMRWFVFDVDFEMYGKDHLTNGEIYSQICETLGGTRPHQMFYELFLDEKYNKISKSKDNSFTLDDWMKYAPRDSLTLFMYLSPQKAKRLYYGCIPNCVDECIKYITSYNADTISDEEKIYNPVYHIYYGKELPELEPNVTYSLLLNLISACDATESDIAVIMKFIQNYLRTKYKKKYGEEYANEAEKAGTKLFSNSFFSSMLHGAAKYYVDFIKHSKKYKKPNSEEKGGLILLKEKLSHALEDQDEIQQTIYDVGREIGFDSKTWFQSLYEILLGTSSGPRLGFFISVYGIAKTIEMIDAAIKNAE